MPKWTYSVYKCRNVGTWKWWCTSFLWLKTTEAYSPTVLEARHLKSRCQWRWFLPRGKDLFQASLLDLQMAIFSLHPCVVFPLGSCVCPNFPFLWGQQSDGSKALLVNSFSLEYLCKDLSWNAVTFWSTRCEDFNIWILGDTIQSIMSPSPTHTHYWHLEDDSAM